MCTDVRFIYHKIIKKELDEPLNIILLCTPKGEPFVCTYVRLVPCQANNFKTNVGI